MKRSGTRLWWKLATSGLVVFLVHPAHDAAAEGMSAIVESIVPARDDVAANQILMEGAVIELKAGQSLVLGYLSSCAHEEIVGGRVTIGAGKSEVEGGEVKWEIVACNGTASQDAGAAANDAAVIVLRGTGGTAPEGTPVVPSRQPVFVLPDGKVPADPYLVIQRLDRAESPIRVSLFAGTLDLKQTGMKLTPGGVYSATCGGRSVGFKIADNAGAEPGPVVTLQRIVLF